MPTLGIVVFAFGTPASISSNRLLADITRQLLHETSAPVFTQADIELRGCNGQVTYIQEEPGQPPPTLTIARAAIEWADKQGLEVLYIIAAEPHFARCLRDLTIAVGEQGSRVRAVRAFSRDSIETENWFCPESTQPRTRSVRDWEHRERILRLMPVWLYKLVAS